MGGVKQTPHTVVSTALIEIQGRWPQHLLSGRGRELAITSSVICAIEIQMPTRARPAIFGIFPILLYRVEN